MNMPEPLIARSRLESVNSMLPWANCCETAATRTPLPVALLDTPCSDTANRSANSAREPLKPLVDVFAMLLAVTLRSVWAALRPDRAIRKGMGCLLGNSLFGLQHALDCAHGDFAERVGVEHERAVVGIERDARHLGCNAGGQGNVLVTHLGDDFDLVASGRRGGADVGAAVPGEAAKACTRVERLRLDERAGGIAHDELHARG